MKLQDVKKKTSHEYSQYNLFQGFSPSQLQLIDELASEVEVSPGITLFEEGDYGTDFYIILSGTVEIWKRPHPEENSVKITEMHAGESFGELILLGDHIRSATAIGSKDNTVKMLKIVMAPLLQNKAYADILDLLLSRLSGNLARHLGYTNSVLAARMVEQEEESKFRRAVEVMFVHVLVLITTYTIALRGIVQFLKEQSNTTAVSVGLLLYFSIICITLVYRSKYPRHLFGVTLKNWRRHAREAILFTIPVLIALFLVKVALVNFIPQFHGMDLFQPRSIFKTPGSFSWLKYFLVLGAYSAFSPVQEFAVRGTLQSIFHIILPPDRKSSMWLAIIVTNLCFMMMHSHLTFTFSVMATIPGIFWGWIYARQRTLVGVSISHILVGVWAVFILGLPHMFR